jgi:hypothetical protein
MSEHAPVCDHPLFTYQPNWPHTGARPGAAVAHVTRSAQLPVAPDAVWAVLSDPHSWADWLTVHRRWVTRTAAPVRAGRPDDRRDPVLGVTNTIEWTVESALPGTLVLVGVGDGGLRVRFTCWLSAAEDGTRLTVTAELTGHRLPSALVAVVETAGAEEVDASITRLGTLAHQRAMPSVRPVLRLVHSAVPETAVEPVHPPLRAVR